MSIQTECGIFSIYSKNEDIELLFVLNKLKNLQHRGRDSFGYSYFQSCKEMNKTKEDIINSKNYLIVEKRIGLVINYLTKLKKNIINRDYSHIKSNNWLSHVRYSTISNKEVKLFDIQPIKSNNKLLGDYSLAHNGNVPSMIWDSILDVYPLFKKDYIQNQISDTNLIVKFINFLSMMEEKNNPTISNEQIIFKILKLILKLIPYSYCLVIQTETKMWFIRDKNGIRPLSLYYNQDTLISASESVILNKNEIKKYHIIHILNGQIAYCNLENKIIKPKILFTYKHPLKSCVFEYLYFMNINTVTNEDSVIKFRHKVSKELSDQILKKSPKLHNHWKTSNAIVSGVPSSGNYYGRQIANFLSLNYIQFLEKKINERTFIMSSNKERLKECHRKYHVNPNINIQNQILILVDDSIVRGNTLTYLVSFLRTFNPKEIHIISASPPIKNPCNYGVDFPDIEDLIYNKVTPKKLPNKLNVESITYLDIHNLTKIKNNSCTACFNGQEL